MHAPSIQGMSPLVAMETSLDPTGDRNDHSNRLNAGQAKLTCLRQGDTKVHMLDKHYLQG